MSTPTKIRITTSLFDYRNIIHQLAEQGRKVFGPHYHIYPEDLPIVIQLIAWMLRDEDVSEQFQLDLNKGIFLGGPVGVGKSQLMQLMQYLSPTQLNYQIVTCTYISEKFSLKGPGVIQKYTYNEDMHSQQNPIRWCFDGLGLEEIAHHYSTYCQVMKKVLMSRYELFTQSGIFTHITSSLTTLEIESRYGKDIRSRMREMFNRIIFSQESRDKRGIKVDFST